MYYVNIWRKLTSVRCITSCAYSYELPDHDVGSSEWKSKIHRHVRAVAV